MYILFLKIKVRAILNKKWARPINFFRTQPLTLIRNYFGEAFALNFAFCGTLTYMLFFPTIVGLVFFIVGIVISSRKTKNDPSINTFQNSSVYGNYYMNLFADSFDNDITPYYAVNFLFISGSLRNLKQNFILIFFFLSN
jgi:hypothetical protein